MAKHYVYMIEESGLMIDRCCKIGVAKDVNKRLDGMQVGNPRILKVAVELGPFSKREAYEVERKMHKCFDRYRVRGEWFDVLILRRMDLLESYEAEQRRNRSDDKQSRKDRKRERFAFVAGVKSGR